MKTVLTRWLTGLGVVLGAGTASAAVSVEEIVRLHTAGLSVQSLLLVVGASDTPDTLSTAQLTQMIEAQVPDTVISALVYKADAVMEDWQPVDLEAEMDGRTVYTETEVRYVYPEWDPWYTWSGWGWCGTPWYSWRYVGYPAYCPAPYNGLYVGYGWDGGWRFSFNVGWGYGCYDPWYWGSRYCGWYDPWYDPWFGYPDHPGYGGSPYYSYREIDRVDYHSGPSRRPNRGGRTTPVRDNVSPDTRNTLSTVDGRRITHADRNTGDRRLRDRSENETEGKSGTSRSIYDLKRVESGKSDKSTNLADRGNDKRLREPVRDDQTGSRERSRPIYDTKPLDLKQDKSTLLAADRGRGRYEIKGDNQRAERTKDPGSGRILEPVDTKTERGSALDRGAKTTVPVVSRETKTDPDRGKRVSDQGRSQPSTPTVRRVESRASSSVSVGEKVNRYVQMKNAQRVSSPSRVNTTSPGTREASSRREAAPAPPRHVGRTSESAPPTTSAPKAQKQQESRPAVKSTATPPSSPKVTRGGGQRSTGSVESPSRRAPTSTGATRGGGKARGTRGSER